MSTYRAFDYTRGIREFYSLFTDFFEYVTADWTLTTVEAGAGSATEAISTANGDEGGVIVVTTDNADNDNDIFQWAGSGGATKEQFKFISGKKLEFAIRFKLSRIDGDFFAGLCITDTDLEGGMTDGIYFRKLAAEAGIKLVVEKDSVETTTTVLTTLVANTWYTLEFYYDGNDAKIKAYLGTGSTTTALPANGSGAPQPAGAVALTTVPDDEALALTFAVQNGSANAQVLSVDYIGARAER